MGTDAGSVSRIKRRMMDLRMMDLRMVDLRIWFPPKCSQRIEGRLMDKDLVGSISATTWIIQNLAEITRLSAAHDL